MGAWISLHFGFTDEEIELFRRKGLTAVTNPGSNTKLASGIANTTAFFETRSQYGHRHRWTSQQQLPGYVPGNVF